MKTKHTEEKTVTATPLAPLARGLLIAFAAAESLLSLFQWYELMVVRSGGTTICGINEVVNCARVWDSPFAADIHRLIGIPVAGLGLVWGLAALGLSVTFALRLRQRGEAGALAGALKLVALAGALTVPVLAVASWTAGAVCLTCLGTYLVVAAFAFVALRSIPGPVLPQKDQELKGAMIWAVGFAVGAYLGLLGPGLATPHAHQTGAELLGRVEKSKAAAPAKEMPSSAEGHSFTAADQALADFIGSLPVQEKQRLSNMVAMFRANGAAAPVQAAQPARGVYGPSDAPLKMVEWVDIRCGHCKQLNDVMGEIKKVSPPGSFSLEARNFPLDSECNPGVQSTEGKGVRCAAAKAMICLEPTKDFWDIRDRLFAAQADLTKDKVMEIASSGAMKRPALEACMASPETAKKLQDDIAWALKFNIEGTPLVVLNGREGFPMPTFLYAMTLTGGAASSPAFDALPPPDLLGSR
jgi:serine/threonine-protein kinase